LEVRLDTRLRGYDGKAYLHRTVLRERLGPQDFHQHRESKSSARLWRLI